MSEYAMPIVRADMTVPCAATRSCIRYTLVLILPRCLNLWNPKPHTPTNPIKPENDKAIFKFKC